MNTLIRTLVVLLLGFAVKSVYANIDLCHDFLINDKSNRPMGHVKKPAPLASYTDPVFGSKVKRISNADAISSGVIKTLYSTVQAWNADESRLILWHRGAGHFLYHGKTYKLLGRLDVEPADIEQVFWSTRNPQVFMYPNKAVGKIVQTSRGNYRLKGQELLEYNISTKHHRIIKDFSSVCPSGNPITAGDDVQMPSHSGDIIGLRCGSNAFTYRISNDQITILDSQNLNKTARLYAPQVFPSGRRSYHHGTVRNHQLAVERTFSLNKPDEHASLGRMHNGRDAYFATGFDPNADNRCHGGIGSVVMHDAASGHCQVLVGQSNGYPYTPSGTHISALAHKNPGWIVASSVGYNTRGDSPLSQELYLTHTSGNKTCRIAHHRSSARHGSIGYFAEPHPVISPNGTRVLFSSDWNNSGKVDVYVVELPTYR